MRDFPFSSGSAAPFHLHETIPHSTESRLFSIHHTHLPHPADPLLYLHWHREFELLYVERGGMLLESEGCSVPVAGGEAVFIPSGRLHCGRPLAGAFASRGDTSPAQNACAVPASVSPQAPRTSPDQAVEECLFHALVFSPELLTGSAPQYGAYVHPFLSGGSLPPLRLTPSVPWQKQVLDRLTPLFELSQKELSSWELLAHGSLLIIWQLLLNHHYSGSVLSKSSAALAQRLAPSLLLMQSEPERELTLETLAAASRLSAGQFCRLFRRLTGCTPFAYLNRCRILKSCGYLTNTDKKIAEIATLCGYNTISYFNRAFLRFMKVTPRQYRAGASRPPA